MLFVDISQSHNINSMWIAFLELRALFLLLRNGVICEHFFFWWLKIIFFCFSLLRDPLIFLGSTRTKSRLQSCTWYYLPICWDWLLGSFGLKSPVMLQSSCLPAIVLWRLAGLRGSAFKITHMVVGRRPLSSSQHGPLRWALYDMTFGLFWSKWSRRSKKQDGSCDVFHNLISEANCHHFCHVLSITQNSTSITWAEITQGFEYNEAAVIGVLLEEAIIWI